MNKQIDEKVRSYSIDTLKPICAFLVVCIQSIFQENLENMLE